MSRLFRLLSCVVCFTVLAACAPDARIPEHVNASHRLTPGDPLPAPYERFIYDGKAASKRLSFTEMRDGRPVRTLNLPFHQSKNVPLDAKTSKRLTFASLKGDVLRLVFRTTQRIQ